MKNEIVDIEIRKKIGQIIKENRKNHNMTQTQLAEKVGVKALSILKYEKGERDIPFSLLIKICDILYITFEDLSPFFLSEKNMVGRIMVDVLTNYTNDIFTNNEIKKIIFLIEFMEKIGFNIFTFSKKVNDKLETMDITYKNFIFNFENEKQVFDFFRFFLFFHENFILEYLKSHIDFTDTSDFTEKDEDDFPF